MKDKHNATNAIIVAIKLLNNIAIIDTMYPPKSDEYVKPNGSKLNHSDLNKATRKVSVNKLIIS